VMFTDAVFWLMLYPFLTLADYRLNLLIDCLHSINAFFLLGDHFELFVVPYVSFCIFRSMAGPICHFSIDLPRSCFQFDSHVCFWTCHHHMLLFDTSEWQSCIFNATASLI